MLYSLKEYNEMFTLMTLYLSEILVQSAQGVCYQPAISKIKKEEEKKRKSHMRMPLDCTTD